MNEFFAILPCVITPLVISAVLPWIYGQSKKEATADGVIGKTKYPRRFTVCSIVALLLTVFLFIVATVWLCVFEKDFPIRSWIAFVLGALLTVSIPLMLVVLSFRTYEIIRDDGILAARLFKKTLIRYSEMTSYRYASNQLTVYGNDREILLTVADNRVGMKALLEQLDRKGIGKEFV